MSKNILRTRLRVEQFTDDLIPEGVIKAPDEILDIIAFFQKEKTSEVQYIYIVPIPSLKDLEFAEYYDIAFPFQYINKGDYVVSLSGIYSCVITKEELQHVYMDLELPHLNNFCMEIDTTFSIKCENLQLI
jgi:hypothetical protein